MSHIHFVGGEKGGVGKSVTARLLAQYFIDKHWHFAAVDADVSHPALVRYYSDFSQAIDLERQESADAIMDRALGADRKVLVDLPAQSVRLLRRWLDGADVMHYGRQLGVDMTFWFVTDGGFDSTRAFEQLVEAFGDNMKYVAVINHGRGRDFSQFKDSSALDQIRHYGGAVLELDELEPATMYAIDRTGASFWAAVNQDAGELALKPMQRQRARLWLEKTYAKLDELGAV